MTPLYRNEAQGDLPDSWYLASAALPPLRAEIDGDCRADVCVVGAGYTGLSAAHRLAQAGLDVIVLDAHRVGFGASGRNGGQVCSGYDSEQIHLIAKYGADHAASLWHLAEEAKSDLRDICENDVPEALYRPGVMHGLYAAQGLKDGAAEVALLAKTYGYDQISLLDAAQTQDIIKSPAYQGGVLDMGAGHIHPLRYVLGLARRAEAAGVRIHEHSEVTQIVQGNPATIKTKTGRVTADHVVLAGNGYLTNLVRDVAARVIPVNSFMCATEPLGDRAADVLTRDIAVNDSRFVANYFRLTEDKRLLMGGRPSYSPGFPKNLADTLKDRITQLFPRLGPVGIDHAWGGTLGVTVPRLPALLRPAPNILAAGGYSGHGVAFSGLAGKIMAEAILGQAGRFDVLNGLNIPAFPGGPRLAQPLLTLAMTWYGLRDRMGF